MINYTIIIPHKNIPHFLVRCLDSIPLREDVQVIVVDDNSDITEVNGINLLILPEKYPNIEFIWGKNENRRKGAGYARNLGLERAKGKWLIFADADDFFMPCFNEVLDKYVDDDSDIIFFKATSINLETLLLDTRHDYVNNPLAEIQRTNNWNIAIQINVPWGKFIKRDIIIKNKINFQEVQHSNDVLFSVKLAIVDAKSKISDCELYCITNRNDSLTSTESAKFLKKRFNVAYNAYTFLKIHKKESYFRDTIWYWWVKVCDVNYFVALSLFFKMCKIYGFSCMLKIVKKKFTNRLKRILR